MFGAASRPSGATRPVALDVVKYGEFKDPGMMGHRISYGATTKISRSRLPLR